MGLSLRNLTKKVWDQVNTLDNGRTFKNPTPTNNRSVVGQLTHNGATNVVGTRFVKPTITSARQGASRAADYGKFYAGVVTHNDMAKWNAGKRIIANINEVNHMYDPKNPDFKQNIANIAVAGEGAPVKGAVTRAVTLKTASGGAITEKDFNKMIPVTTKTTPSLTPEELANLPSKEQMALHHYDVPLNEPEINTARNPFKAPIPKVAPGDYKQVISNEQTAANPTLVAGDRWKAAMQKLQKNDPESFKNFWRHVENPKAAKTPELKQAITTWRNVDDRIHGTSQQLGGNTNYLTDHGLHPWNLPEGLAQHLTNGGDPKRFSGLNNISRKYRTIAEGEANGLKLGEDPLSEGAKYISASSGMLRRRAIVKGLGEADGHIAEKTHYLDTGSSETIPISSEAHKALRGLQTAHYSENIVPKGVRTLNSGLRSTILSGGQFHPINISVMRAGPSLVVAGHPIRAIKGVAGTFSATKGRVGKMYDKALSDKVIDPGTGQHLSLVDAAAKIGAPYSQRGFDVGGSALKSGVGHKLVFEQQIPMMHDQVVRSVVSDLVRKGIPLDSKAARQAGIAANSTMGFINKEALNLPTWVRKGMSDWMLASQFTPSKFVTLSKVAKGGVAGKYARADVVSNAAAATAIIIGAGYLMKQKSDNIRDSLLRAIVNPSVPTPYKDKKGNNVELRTPLTYTSELAHLLGIKLKRGSDDHLTVDWKPGNAPSTISEWMRSRLAPVQSDALRVATNTDFADKPLYDPNAPAGKKVIQAVTTITQGSLPIGAQGLPNTKVVKDHLPDSAREVLDANSPGSNPLLKSGLSSAGFTPRADQTVGKGKDTAQYFAAVDKYGKGLDRQSKDAFDLWTGSKKNPVTGKYDVAPNVNDARTKAAALLENPKALNSIIGLNQAQQAKSGQKTDPLWSLPKDQITKYLQYQNMPPGGADKTDWYNKNGSWYGPLVDARNKFFSSLPPGDPNKPKLDLQYPEATKQVSSLMDQYSGMTDSKQKGQFLDSHPELIKQWNAQADYTNKLREQLGYSPLKDYPEATPRLQEFMDAYSNASKGQRTAIRNSNPQKYQEMVSYFDSVDLYNIGKQASVAQLKGEPDYTSKEANSISNLASDIYQKPDGTYSVSGYYGSSGSSPKSASAYKYAVSNNTGRTSASPKITVSAKGSKGKVTSRKASKPKVSLKKSQV